MHFLTILLLLVIVLTIKECDFLIDIEKKGRTLRQIITNFTLPENPVKVSASANTAFLLVPDVTISGITVTFLSLPSNHNISTLHEWYFDQFEDGLLKVISEREKPKLSISIKPSSKWWHMYPNEPILLFRCEGVFLGYPKPSAAIESTKFSKFTMDINYTKLIFE